MAVHTRYIDAVIKSGVPLVGELDGLFYDMNSITGSGLALEVASVDKILPSLDEYIDDRGGLKIGDFVVVIDDTMPTGGYVRKVCTNAAAKLVNSFSSRNFVYVIPSEEI